MVCTAGIRHPAETTNRPLLQSVQTGSGVHPVSYLLDRGGAFLGDIRSGCEAHHSPPSSSDVKKLHSPVRHGVA
jgi:hypothetical protein